MTANDIQILAYYHVFPDDHPCIEKQWVRNSINNLIQQKLIKPD